MPDTPKFDTIGRISNLDLRTKLSGALGPCRNLTQFLLDSMCGLIDITSIKENMELVVPFKEKIAWISVATTLLVWGGYFGFMAFTQARMSGAVYFAGFAGAVVVQVVLVVVAGIVTAVLAPKDASAGSDERDREIARRAYALAYPVLLTLIVCVAASIHVGATPRDMAYEIMGAIAVAEIVHYGAQIQGYRSGRHG